MQPKHADPPLEPIEPGVYSTNTLDIWKRDEETVNSKILENVNFDRTWTGAVFSTVRYSARYSLKYTVSGSGLKLCLRDACPTNA